VQVALSTGPGLRAGARRLGLVWLGSSWVVVGAGRALWFARVPPPPGFFPVSPCLGRWALACRFGCPF